MVHLGLRPSASRYGCRPKQAHPLTIQHTVTVSLAVRAVERKVALFRSPHSLLVV